MNAMGCRKNVGTVSQKVRGEEVAEYYEEVKQKAVLECRRMLAVSAV